MQATVVDLRYRMNDVLKALERNEDVEILYRGKKRGVLVAQGTRTRKKVASHPFFDMHSSRQSVDAMMQELRGGRCGDL